MSVRNYCAALLAGAMALTAGTAQAVSVELVFMLDYSGSNDTRRASIAGQMGTFIAAMEADDAIDDVKIAVMGSESQEAVLVQQMTDDIDLLNAAITADLNNFGGSLDEDYLDTMLSALPESGNLTDGGQPFVTDRPYGNLLGIEYSANAIKSFVVLADEPEQSTYPMSVYQPVFAASEMLVNVIVPYTFDPDQGTDPASWDWSCETGLGLMPGFTRRISGGGRLGLIAKPSDGVFSICAFDDDPTAFFEGFAAAKISEIREEGGFGPVAAAVPLPPAAPLLGLAMLGLYGLKRRRLH